MKKLFLGVGNAMRGDDAVGPVMAERLGAHAEFKIAGICVEPHSGEGASLIHFWEEQDAVVIVDCMKTGLPLGTVRRFDVLKEKLNGGVFRYSSHLFGLAEAVEMSRQLGSLPRHMIIYGIEGRVFDFGAPLSPEVEAALPGVVTSILNDFGMDAGAASDA